MLYIGRNKKKYRFYRMPDDLHFLCCGTRFGTRDDLQKHIANYQEQNEKQHPAIMDKKPDWMSR